MVVPRYFGRARVAEEAEVRVDALELTLGVPDVPADQVAKDLTVYFELQ